ncbi:hypothetical protein [Rhodoferax sp.]|jgi:hypothetical protein|uniref:hypothetical protein n=1 Tax=Rhodoferax sp. TaxID=50421 RepID=UPI0037847084
MKKLTQLLMLALAISTSAYAQSNDGSKAISMGAASIVASPVLSLEGRPLEASAALGVGGSFVVGGLVVASVELVTLTLKNVATGSQYVIKASGKAVQGASVAVGTSVRVVAESTGYAVIASGKLLAFIPNAIGEALLHHSEVK